MPSIKINKRVVTPYQEIIDTNITLFGEDLYTKKRFKYNARCVLIDRMYQFCNNWYYEYHFFSYLVPTLFFAPNKPLNILVIGGGDLIGSSMLLKYANVNRIDLIDIDKKMIELAKTDFNSFFFEKKPWKDKRLKIHIGDAFVYINKLIREKRRYDVIVYDLPVINNYKLLPLLSIEFLKRLYKLSKKDTVFSIYQEIGGTDMLAIKKEALLVGCAGFKSLLFERGFKIKPSNYIDYEDNFFYFANSEKAFKIRNKNLFKKMLLNSQYLIDKFYNSGTLYMLKCPKNIRLNSIFRPDFSILTRNFKEY